MGRELKKIDWILVGAALLLSGVGLISIYAGSHLKDPELMLFKKQLIFLILGFILMISLATFFDLRFLKASPFFLFLLYLFTLISLLLLFVFGTKIRGTLGWFQFSIVSLQPIEFTKLILVLVLAKYFSMRHVEMYRVQHLLISGLYVFLPSLLAFFQPDLGSILILILIWLGFILIAEVKLKHFIIILILGGVIFGTSWIFILKDYQKARFLNFINPRLDPQGYGYQTIQSLIAVGSAGILGKGLGKGTQTQYGFLPEAQTDFIFAAISEELGLIGILLIFILYILLFHRIIKIAILSKNNFFRLTASGIAIMIFSQIFINIGMNIRLFPITGVPLPFLSYGGSSLITMFLALGILENIKIKST